MGRIPMDTLVKLAVIVLIACMAAQTVYLMVTGR